MSYAVSSKCGICQKRPECIDGDIILGAVNTIHQLNGYVAGEFKSRGHQGGGTIQHECINYVENQPKPAE